MTLAFKTLAKALLTIKDDAGGVYLQNRFQSLSTQTLINGAEGQRKTELRDPYYFAAQDFDNLLTIVLRLDWQKGLWARGDLNDIHWIKFVEADVHLLHVEFRSLFDYLAPIIRHVSDKPGQVRIGESNGTASFEKLWNWTTESKGNANRLGSDLAAIVGSCGWFKDLRGVRNTLVHQGGTATALVEERGRILFQVHDRNFLDRVLIEEVMYRDNIVDFERYAGMYLGYLLDLLDEVGCAVHERLALEDKSRLITYRHPALRVVRDWMRAVAA